MFKFTSLFMENFLGTAGSLLPSSTTLSATGTSYVGSLSTQDGEELGSTVGCLLTSTGTAIYNSANSAYDKTLKQLELTEAYMESLSDEELNQMIEKLENMEVVSNEESSDVLIKIKKD